MNIPFGHVVVHVEPGAATYCIEIVVDGGENEAGARGLHLRHEAPLLQLRVVTFHARPVRLERLVEPAYKQYKYRVYVLMEWKKRTT